MSDTRLQIGDVAHLLGITPKAVRHYHKLGLLSEPPRSEGGYRLYRAEDVLHLRRIRRLQAVGLSLQQIKDILVADEPDKMLQQTLEALYQDLTVQQAEIAERRQRVEQLLAEEASLVEAEQVKGTSVTYEQLMRNAQPAYHPDEVMTEFDRQVFAEWDAIQLGDAYSDIIQGVESYFQADEGQAAAFVKIAARMAQLETVPVDDPRIEAWALAARSIILGEIVPDGLGFAPMSPSIADVMRQIFLQSAEQHLAPAQRRFIDLLISQEDA